MTGKAGFGALVEDQEYRSGTYRVDADRIKAFAAEFDPQPQHLDEAEAAVSQFGGLVASGWHTASLGMRMFIDAFPQIPSGAMGTGVERLVWLLPVRPNDELYGVTRIVSSRISASRPDKRVLTCLVTVRNQHDQDVIRFETTMLVPRDAH